MKLLTRLLPIPAVLLLAVGVTSTPAASVTAARAAGDSAASRAKHVAGNYRNPLTLRLPGAKTAESCADPFVLHGRGGDSSWYLYCTSDALTSTDRDPAGHLVIHNLPTFRSHNLVTWTYAGDALPAKPSWVKADAGLWAPDVVYRGGRYLLYYTASDTVLPGGGSAIGVATAASPTGPWTDTGTQAVAPEDSPSSPGARRWVFDPEVITAGGRTYIYYGSYFGGVSVRQLSTDGLTSDPSTERQIAIDNRYEGTFIVQHAGWYYFMGSATNCCNGPLTGYAVFAARSRSPLGPFRDRDGVSILASRVGGTPVLTQNGNRWVGTGHNAVVTDYSGQDWIVYHAVDRTDPYYAGEVGYTKRPALIDPLDWRHGWPTVRGGRGPSDHTMAGPAAQPRQRTAYRPRFESTIRPGKRIAALSDNFGGSTLSPQWSWVRQPSPSTFGVANGHLHWQTQAADLHPPDNSAASVLIERAPSGDYLVETRVAVDVPAEGCCFNYVQGGLVIYGGDDNYVKLASVSIWNTRQSEFGKQAPAAAPGYPTYGNTVVGPVGARTYLRIARQRAAGEDRYTAYTSLDGRHWDKGGTWTTARAAATKIGLISMGGAGFTSTFDFVRVSTLVR